jgi:hypothetical protein
VLPGLPLFATEVHANQSSASLHGLQTSQHFLCLCSSPRPSMQADAQD